MPPSTASEEQKEDSKTANFLTPGDYAETLSLAEDLHNFNHPAASTPTGPDRLIVEDGGTRAWLQVAGVFVVFINLWGFAFAFGAFQSYYELNYLTESTPSNISWIGTTSSFLLVFIGVISGPLFDLGYFKSMLLVGATIQTLSVFLLSLCKNYWQILLVQGVFQGLGTGLLYLPALALVGRSFQKRRALAMGILTCGAPAGGIIYTLIFTELIDRIDFDWTVRIMGFVMLASYIISFPLLLWGVHNLGDLASGTPRKLFDRQALKDVPFWCFSIGQFFLFWGYIVPFFYMATYGQNVLGLSQSFSLYIIIIAQATSIAGRLGAAYAATKVGVCIPWMSAGLISGVLCIAWIGVRSTGSLIAFSALYGFFSAPYVPLPPSIFPVVCPWPEVLGARLGMAQAINSIATLTGGPIAGALLRVGSSSAANDHSNYLGLQLFSGCVMMLGAVSIGALWVSLQRTRDVKRLI